MTSKNNSISIAQELARQKHEQFFLITGSGTKSPQISHIQQVADLVWIAGGNTDQITAAWLHDTVEDTDLDIEYIRSEFGDTVADLVDGLTDPLDFATLSTLERKKLQAERIATKSMDTKLIKLADQISNVNFLATDPPEIFTTDMQREYIAGAKLIADACSESSPFLYNLFNSVYQKAVDRYGVYA